MLKKTGTIVGLDKTPTHHLISYQMMNLIPLYRKKNLFQWAMCSILWYQLCPEKNKDSDTCCLHITTLLLKERGQVWHFLELRECAPKLFQPDTLKDYKKDVSFLVK